MGRPLAWAWPQLWSVERRTRRRSGHHSAHRRSEQHRIDPDRDFSADLAETFGLKTYTIGVGTNGMASTPVSIDARGPLDVPEKTEVEIDEELLQEIAKKTGGQYFRATNNESLQAIYQEIDKLEKKEVEELRYYAYTELFRPFILWAFGLLFSELLLKNTLLRSLN